MNARDPRIDRSTPPARDPWRRWLRQPALHFLLIALALLALDLPSLSAADAPEATPVDDAVVLERLQRDFKEARGREMTEAEARAALEDHRYEQTLFRAAVEMGMHETDPIVRRRLVQRMRFLVENMVQVPPPSDEDLSGWLAERPDQFPPTRTLSFEHRFFSRSAHGANTRRAAAEARTKLVDGQEVSGDPFPRRLPVDDIDVRELARIVGPDTAEAFFEAEADTWSAPIPSAYGTHLVRVTDRTTRPVSLDEVRPRVVAQWERTTRRAQGRALMRSIAGAP